MSPAAPACSSGAAADAPRLQRPRDVLVVNDTDQAVPVREVGRETREPFHRQFVLDWSDGSGFSTGSYSVPSGKRLVVEYASLSAYLPPSGQTMFVRVTTTVGGADAFHRLAVQEREDYGLLKQFEGALMPVLAPRYPARGTSTARNTSASTP